MPKPSEIISVVSVLMNDAAQTQYNNTTCLPFLNLALNNLQELYELNGLGVTDKTSAAIIVPSGPAGITKIGFDTVPALPSDLIEIQELWETPVNQNQWIPLVKKDFIPHYLEDNTQTTQFFIWAWENDHIVLVTANAINQLKIDYVCSVFNFNLQYQC
jgi:hypothetical protein